MSKKARLTYYKINLPSIKSATLELTNNEISKAFRVGAKLGSVGLSLDPTFNSIGLLTTGLPSPVKVKINKVRVVNKPEVVSARVTTSPSRAALGKHSLVQQPFVGTSSTYVDSSNQVQSAENAKLFAALTGAEDGIVATAVKVATAKIFSRASSNVLSARPLIHSFLQTGFPLVKAAQILAAIFFYTPTFVSTNKVTSKIDEFKVIKTLLNSPVVASLVSKDIGRNNEKSFASIKAIPTLTSSPVKIGLADLVDEQTFHTIDTIKNLELSASSKAHFTFGRPVTTNTILQSLTITGTNRASNASAKSDLIVGNLLKSTGVLKSFPSKLYNLRRDIIGDSGNETRAYATSNPAILPLITKVALNNVSSSLIKGSVITPRLNIFLETKLQWFPVFKNFIKYEDQSFKLIQPAVKNLTTNLSSVSKKVYEKPIVLSTNTVATVTKYVQKDSLENTYISSIYTPLFMLPKTALIPISSRAIPGAFRKASTNLKALELHLFSKEVTNKATITEDTLLKTFFSSKTSVPTVRSNLIKGRLLQREKIRFFSLSFKKPMLVKTSVPSVTSVAILDPFQKSIATINSLNSWQGRVHGSTSSITSTPWLDPFLRETLKLNDSVQKFYRANKTDKRFGQSSASSRAWPGRAFLSVSTRIFSFKKKFMTLPKISTMKIGEDEDSISKFYRSAKKGSLTINARPMFGPYIDNTSKIVGNVTKFITLPKISTMKIGEDEDSISKFYRAIKSNNTQITSNVAKGPVDSALLEMLTKSHKQFNKNNKNSFVTFHPMVDDGVKTKVSQTSALSLDPNQSTSHARVDISDPLDINFHADVDSNQVDYKTARYPTQLMPGQGGQYYQGGAPLTIGNTKNVIAHQDEFVYGASSPNVYMAYTGSINYFLQSVSNRLPDKLRRYAEYNYGSSQNNFKDATGVAETTGFNFFRREYVIEVEYSVGAGGGKTDILWNRVFIPTSETTSTQYSFQSYRTYNITHVWHYKGGGDTLWNQIPIFSAGYLRQKSRLHTMYPQAYFGPTGYGRGKLTLTFETVEQFYVNDTPTFITSAGYSNTRNSLIPEKSFVVEDSAISEYDTLEIPFSYFTAAGFETFTVNSVENVLRDRDILKPADTVNPGEYVEFLGKITQGIKGSGTGTVTTTETLDKWIILYKYPNPVSLSDPRLAFDNNVRTYSSSKFLDKTNFIEEDTLLIPTIDFDSTKAYTVTNSDGDTVSISYLSDVSDILAALNTAEDSVTVQANIGSNTVFTTTYTNTLSPSDPRLVQGLLYQTDGPLVRTQSFTKTETDKFPSVSKASINSNNMIRGRFISTISSAKSLPSKQLSFSAELDDLYLNARVDIKQLLRIKSFSSVKSTVIIGRDLRELIGNKSIFTKQLRLKFLDEEGRRVGGRTSIDGLDRLFFNSGFKLRMIANVASSIIRAKALLPFIKTDIKAKSSKIVRRSPIVEDLKVTSLPQKLLDNKNPLKASMSSSMFPAYAVIPKNAIQTVQDYFLVFKVKDLNPSTASISGKFISNRPIKSLRSNIGLVSSFIRGRNPSDTSKVVSSLFKFSKKDLNNDKLAIKEDQTLAYISKPLQIDKSIIISNFIRGKNNSSLVGIGKLTKLTKKSVKNRHSNVGIDGFNLLLKDVTIDKKSSMSIISSKDLIRGIQQDALIGFIAKKELLDIVKHTQNQLSLASPDRLIMDMKLKLPEDLANLADSGSLFNQSYSHAYFMEGYVGEERLF